jgi:hypothetical protein
VTGKSSPDILILGGQHWDVSRLYMEEDINSHQFLPFKHVQQYSSDLSAALRNIEVRFCLPAIDSGIPKRELRFRCRNEALKEVPDLQCIPSLTLVFRSGHGQRKNDINLSYCRFSNGQ